MPGSFSLLKYWVPVLLWMAIIFSASSDSMSSGHTSRIIGPLVRWVIPDISEEALGRVVFVVRKTAHVTEYAVLALLLWRARRYGWAASERQSVGALDPHPEQSSGPFTKINPNPWRWSEALFALTVAALYASSDEFHQYFVPSREARFGDVMLDTAGAALGLACLWLFGRWRHRW